MTLAARCDRCGTLFRVVRDQLWVSDGWVRCGHCGEVFDAFDELYDLTQGKPPPWQPLPHARTAGAAAEHPGDASGAGTEVAPIDGSFAQGSAARPDEALLGLADAAPVAPEAGDEFAAVTGPGPEEGAGNGANAALLGVPLRPTAGAKETAAVQWANGGRRAAMDSSSMGQPAAGGEVREDAPTTDPLASGQPGPDVDAAAAPEAITAGSMAAVDQPASDMTGATGERSVDRSATAIATPTSSPAADDGQAAAFPVAAEPASAVTPSPTTGSDTATPTPEFVRRAEKQARWKQPRVRLALCAAAVLALVLLAVQTSLHFRHRLAAESPLARAGLGWLCSKLDCRIEAPRRITDLTVESSTLTRVSGDERLIRVSLTLHNRGRVPLAMPAIDLSLKDGAGRLLVRRAIRPQELPAAPASLPPRVDVPLQMLVATDGRRIASYTIEIFYP